MSSLVVPVNVAALCVGAGDATTAQASFTKLAADFHDVPYLDANLDVVNPDGHLLGSAVLPRPFTPDTVAPPAGVHLHWALPAALARGASEAGKLTFRAAPNRWLVVRVRANAALAAWILESDQLWEGGDGETATDALAQNALSRAVPTGASRADKGFRRLGRIYPVADYHGNAGQQYLDRLTAIGYSTPAFAAAYPHCRNVFGCHDPLEGIDDESVSYLVTGWYADLAQDPVASFAFDPALSTDADRAAALADAFGWSFDASEGVPTRTVCSGIVRAVGWQRAGAFLGQGLPADDEHPTIVVGNTLAESFARLIAGTEPQVSGADHLIEALALGALHDVGDPDALLTVEETRHQSRFASQPGGVSWYLKPASAGSAPDASDQLGTGVARQDPPPCAEKLDALNARQRELEARSAELDTRRGQIYADWCRYISSVHSDHPDVSVQAQSLIEQELSALTAAEASLADATTRLTDARAAVETAVGAEWAVTSTQAPRHWMPADPVVLMSGAALDPSDRYGTSDSTVRLACRHAGELITSVTSGGVTITTAGLATLSLDPVIPNVPGELPALLGEALLLIGYPDAPVAAGTASDPIALATWTQPWIPLFLQWETDVGGVQPVGEVASPGAQYAADLLSARYGLADDEPEMRLSGALPVPDASCACAGTTTLAARVDLRLRDALATYAKRYPDDARAGALTTIGDALTLPAMAQRLSGFHAALLMRYRELQLPPYDPIAPSVDTSEVAFSDTDVATAVRGSPSWEPLAGRPFDPLRATTFRVSRLRVVDAFGRSVTFDAPATVVARSLHEDAVTDATVFGDANADEVAVLPPRLVQGGRLQFRWMSAADPAFETNSDPATSPIFGWLLFDRLDTQLLVFDAAGTPVASLGTGGQPLEGAPGNADTYGKDPAAIVAELAGDTAHPANRHLAAFLEGVRTYADGARSAGDYVGALLDAIDAQLGLINPGGSDDAATLGLLVGRPLALARASLSLELLGSPAIDQSLDALGQRSAGAPAEPASGPDGGIGNVAVPVRLGDPGKAADGLVGYFVDPAGGESAAGYQRFLSWSAGSGATGVSAPSATETTVRPAPVLDPAPARTVSLLLDPRGSVHATTGLLPVKSIQIPPDLYAGALRSLSVAFLTAPVLLGGGGFPVPVPAEPGYAWSWETKTSDGFASAPMSPTPAAASGTFVPGAIEEGWLKLDPAPAAAPAPAPTPAPAPLHPDVTVTPVSPHVLPYPGPVTIDISITTDKGTDAGSHLPLVYLSQTNALSVVLGGTGTLAGSGATPPDPAASPGADPYLFITFGGLLSPAQVEALAAQADPNWVLAAYGPPNFPPTLALAPKQPLALPQTIALDLPALTGNPTVAHIAVTPHGAGMANRTTPLLAAVINAPVAGNQPLLLEFTFWPAQDLFYVSTDANAPILNTSLLTLENLAGEPIAWSSGSPEIQLHLVYDDDAPDGGAPGALCRTGDVASGTVTTAPWQGGWSLDPHISDSPAAPYWRLVPSAAPMLTPAGSAGAAADFEITGLHTALSAGTTQAYLSVSVPGYNDVCLPVAIHKQVPNPDASGLLWARADPAASVVAGEAVTITWRAFAADQVQVTVAPREGGAPTQEFLAANVNVLRLDPNPTSDVSVDVVALDQHGNAIGTSWSASIFVRQARVTSFTSDVAHIGPGERAVLTWTTEDADAITLTANGTVLPRSNTAIPRGDSFAVWPNPGANAFVLTPSVHGHPGTPAALTIQLDLTMDPNPSQYFIPEGSETEVTFAFAEGDPLYGRVTIADPRTGAVIEYQGGAVIPLTRSNRFTFTRYRLEDPYGPPAAVASLWIRTVMVKSLAPAPITAFATGGNLWFGAADAKGAYIGYLDPNLGVHLSGAMASNLTIRALAQGPGGVWAATSGANLVLFDSNFQPVKSIAVPGGAPATHIMAGSDGNIYFTAGQFGRLNPSTNAISLFGPTSTFGGIADGSADATVWFSDTGGNTLCALLGTGEVMPLPLPSGMTSPGAVIHTSGGNPSVLTSTGMATCLFDYSMAPTPFSLASPIGDAVLGPDGNLWLMPTGEIIAWYVTPNGPAVSQVIGYEAWAPPGMSTNFVTWTAIANWQGRVCYGTRSGHVLGFGV